MIRKGFTGAGLAKAAGISQGYIVYILQGKRSILPPTAKKICDALGCEFDEIFEIKAVQQ
jgi:transcriptional regulator with XRE-family HTH domain